MEAFKAIFQHGKLYNRETKQRIHIAEKAMVTIILENKDIMSNDPYNEEHEVEEDLEILKEIEKKLEEKKIASYKKIASANSYLTFEIKAGKKSKAGSQALSYKCRLKILNDLYIIQKNSTNCYGVVYPCSCIVEETFPNIPFFEKIHAYSLNDAYMKTYDWYFTHYGKPTTNIYDHFSLENKAGQNHLCQLRMFP
jgi:hypothetical protein